VNFVCVSGFVSKDPELLTATREDKTKISCCRFSVAVKSKFKNSRNEYDTYFFNVISWRELADLCKEKLTKGGKVAVSGYLQTRSYEVNDTKKYITDIVAENVEFLTPKTEEKVKEEKVEKFVPIDDDNLPF
jgi:single-strand DNA-binding protein